MQLVVPIAPIRENCKPKIWSSTFAVELVSSHIIPVRVFYDILTFLDDPGEELLMLRRSSRLMVSFFSYLCF